MLRFSVVIPCYRSASTLAACLESLETQTFAAFETLVIDSTPGDRRCGEIADRFAKARYYHHPERLGAHAARNLAAGLARGEILAFIDPDMTADSEWLMTLDRCRGNSPRAVVGGGVDCPRGYWVRAVHLTKYGWWLSGGRPAARSQLPSGNLGIARDLFVEMGGFPDRFWEGDTELSYRLRARGVELRLAPDARTVHFDAPTVGGFLRERWLRGLDTGLARRARMQWRAAHRIMRIGVAPLTWMVMMTRSARLAWISGWGVRWVAASPVIGAGLAAWVAGECRALVASR